MNIFSIKLTKIILPSYLAILLPVSIIPVHASYDQSYCYIGKAYDIESNALVYYEYHYEKTENRDLLLSETVVYKDPNKNIFAEKKLNYKTGLTTPSFKLIDNRNGYNEGVNLNNNNLDLFVQTSEKSRIKRESLKKNSNTVIDAGFDHFIRLNWQNLQKGETLYVNFISPVELDSFEFRIKKIDNSKSNDISNLEMSINNRFLRLFLDPILLEYSNVTNRILSYEGVSNINNNDGKKYRVRIEYDYENSMCAENSANT